jgi:predicted DCC family thiol-disulfide oxidoreductase YuxK
MAIPESARGLLLFDGPCVLCHGTAFRLARRDRRGRLLFAPLEGETAARLLGGRGPAGEPATVLYLPWPVSPGVAPLVRSRAILAALAELGGSARVAASLLRLVPRPVADRLYDAVARRRTRWFGRREACPLPPPGTAARFLP